MDITAAVRLYALRLVSQYMGSGNVSMNHSCMTGGYLTIPVLQLVRFGT